MSSPDQMLIDAARNYARRTAGQGVRRLTVTLDDGTRRMIEVPQAVAGSWPPARGWSMKGDRGSWNGEAFRLAGKSSAIFAKLIEVGDEGIDASALKLAVWDSYTDERTVQNAVSRLRQLVRESLSLEEDVDPIESCDERYRLVAVG